MMFAGFVIFFVILAIIGLWGLHIDMIMNYKTKEGNTIFWTEIDYIKDHKIAFLVVLSFILISIILSFF
jgi:hypothetical protein